MDNLMRITLVFCALCTSCFAVEENQAAEIKSYNIISDIRFRFAKTRIVSEIENLSNTSTQVSFDVTLPNSAYITDSTFEIDGVKYKSRVEERWSAKKNYGVARSQGAPAGHVRQSLHETNKFNVLINLPPMRNVLCNLTYEEVLRRRNGVYKHDIYIDPGQPVPDMTINVAIQDFRDIVKLSVPDVPGYETTVLGDRKLKRIHSFSRGDNRRTSRDMGNKEGDVFSVIYDVERGNDAGDVLVSNGFFIHFFAPVVRDSLPSDVLFILDTSTSMMNNNKLSQLRTAMKVILSDLHADDRFNIISFGSRVKFWKEDMVTMRRRTVDRAVQYINDLKTSGWTNIYEPIKAGVEYLSEKSRSPEGSLIIFLTDGRPTTGETSHNTIIKNIRAANKKNIPLYTLAFGPDADWELIKRLGLQNFGIGRRIYTDGNPAQQIEGFYQEISTTMLHGVSFQYSEDVSKSTGADVRRFKRGSELLVTGMMKLNETLHVNVSGQSSRGIVDFSSTTPETELEAPVGMFSSLYDDNTIREMVTRMWAYLNIQELLRRRVGEPQHHEREKLKQQALKLSLKYGFVTSLTSLLVQLPEPEEIDRGSSPREYVANFHEDEDLYYLDDVPLPTPPPLSRWHYGWGRGGGGGDPHFMVYMEGLNNPLCFDVKGHNNAIYQFVQDPQTGFTVNGKMRNGKRRNKNGSIRSFIVEMAILYDDVQILATMSNISLNGVNYSWVKDFNLTVPGAQLFSKTIRPRLRRLTVAFNNGLRFDVNRHVHPKSNQFGDDSFDFEIGHHHLLSEETDGVLGQFIHKKVRLQSITYREGYLIGYLRTKTGLEVGRGKARLFERQDPVWGDDNSCWLLKRMAASIFDAPPNYYIIKSMFETKLF